MAAGGGALQRCRSSSDEVKNPKGRGPEPHRLANNANAYGDMFRLPRLLCVRGHRSPIYTAKGYQPRPRGDLTPSLSKKGQKTKSTTSVARAPTTAASAPAPTRTAPTARTASTTATAARVPTTATRRARGVGPRPAEWDATFCVPAPPRRGCRDRPARGGPGRRKSPSTGGIAAAIYSNNLAPSLVPAIPLGPSVAGIAVTFRSRAGVIAQLTRVAVTKIKTATRIASRRVHLIRAPGAVAGDGVLHDGRVGPTGPSYPRARIHSRVAVAIGPPAPRGPLQARRPLNRRPQARP